MREEANLHQHEDDAQNAQIHVEVVLERVNVLLDFEQAQQAQQAEHAQEAQELERPRVSDQDVDELDRHRRRRVDPKPAAQVVLGDLGARRDPLGRRSSTLRSVSPLMRPVSCTGRNDRSILIVWVATQQGVTREKN